MMVYKHLEYHEDAGDGEK